MKKNILILIVFGWPAFMRAQVTVQKGAALFLGAKAELIIQGDLNSEEDILGAGTIILNGTVPQTIHLSNKKLPQLLINNSNHVDLSSPLSIEKGLTLTSGCLRLGLHHLYLGSESFIEGGPTAYIQTDNNGRVIKSIQNDLPGLMIPIGTSQGYTPLLLRSHGSYRKGAIEIEARSSASPDKPVGSRDYLEHYWIVARSGITGDVIATAFYRKVTGQEENVEPYYWNGTAWVSTQTPVDTRNRLFTVNVPEGRGQIYAMRKGDELLPAKNSITLLPNPVKSTATLIIRSTSDESTTVRITDSRGSIVFAKKIMLRKGLNHVNINVMGLTNGYYTIASTTKTNRPISMIKN